MNGNFFGSVLFERKFEKILAGGAGRRLGQSGRRLAILGRSQIRDARNKKVKKEQNHPMSESSNHGVYTLVYTHDYAPPFIDQPRKYFNLFLAKIFFAVKKVNLKTT